MFKITKTNQQTVLEWKPFPGNKPFLKSIVKTISSSQKPFLSSSYTSLSFLPFSFCSLREKQINQGINKKYETSVQLLYDLKQQNDALIEQGYSFYSMSLDSIYCIDSIFVCLDPRWIKPFNPKTKVFSFASPFERNMFCSPEMNAITQLPCSLSISCFEYTLASLAFFLLFDSPLSIVSLHSIAGTKLYWFFQRMLKQNTFLFI